MSQNTSSFSTYIHYASIAWEYQPTGSYPSKAVQHLARVVGIVFGGILDVLVSPFTYFSSSSQQISSGDNVDPALRERVDGAAEKAGIRRTAKSFAGESSLLLSDASSSNPQPDPNSQNIFARISSLEGFLGRHQEQIGKLERAECKHLSASPSREIKSFIPKAKELEARVTALETKAAQFEASAQKKEAEFSQKFDALETKIKNVEDSIHKLLCRHSVPAVLPPSVRSAQAGSSSYSTDGKNLKSSSSSSLIARRSKKFLTDSQSQSSEVNESRGGLHLPSLFERKKDKKTVKPIENVPVADVTDE